MEELRLTDAFIMDTISNYFGICRKSLLNHGNQVEVRQICIFLIHKYTQWDFSNISYRMQRSSTYSIWAYNRCRERRRFEPEYAKKVQMAEDHLIKMHYMVTEVIEVELL